jgi:predicted kinase
VSSTRDRLILIVSRLPGTGKSSVADAAGRHLQAPVLGHDWAMSGLRNFPEVQNALDAMDPPGHRQAGWSILIAFAQAQLRRDLTVVLDGVARVRELDLCRSLAVDEQARFVVILTECDGAAVHRSRIEGRRRGIPNWYELDWDHVLRSRDSWTPIEADLVLDATQPLEANLDRARRFLDGMAGT